MDGLPEAALAEVVAYFQLLSKPTRRRILKLLRLQALGVAELAQRCGCSAAHVPRRRTLLTPHGLVARASRRNSAAYGVADALVAALCDRVCANIARRFERSAQQRAAFVAAAPPVPVGRRAWAG